MRAHRGKLRERCNVTGKGMGILYGRLSVDVSFSLFLDAFSHERERLLRMCLCTKVFLILSPIFTIAQPRDYSL